VRGYGLFCGIELVKDKESLTPNPELLADVWEKTKDYGLLVGKGGRHLATFRIQPTMCLEMADIDFAINVFDRSFRECLNK